MFETMTIAFREGMEAFLIVAISLAYLVRTGRPQLKKPVFYGIGFAVVASTILGVWLKNVSDNPLTEGLLAVVAGLLVGTFTVHMIKVARTMGQGIRETLEAHANKTGFWASFGVFAFVSLMITREGMETVLMMSAVSYQTTILEMYAGIVAGLGLAALMGYFWVRKSHLINIGRFLQVSSIFLVIFSFHLFLYGLHELSETGLVPLLSDGVFH
jgi:high-affinity iron transporter